MVVAFTQITLQRMCPGWRGIGYWGSRIPPLAEGVSHLQVPDHFAVPLTRKPQVPFCSTTRPLVLVTLTQLPIGGAEACALAVWMLITPSSMHAIARQSVLTEMERRTIFIFSNNLHCDG